MITDKNLILHLPFDDPDGYNKAFDYSQSRADGILSEGACLTKEQAKIGKSLDLAGAGECAVPKAISFSTDFSLCFYVRSTTATIGWMLNFSGIDNYIEQWLDVVAGEWVYFAFVKHGRIFTVYRDGNEVYRSALSATPVGFSMNDPNVSGCYACLDEVKLFNVAKTQAEVLKLQSDGADVEYYVDGQNFKTFGVYVSKSDGLVGMLGRKEALSVNYENYHGVVVDKKRPRFKERTITLECFMEAQGKSAFVNAVQLFMSKFQGAGNQRLVVEYDGKARPLVYEVYCPDAVDVSKSWTFDNVLMVGTFKIKLVECEPVKRVLRHIGVSANSIARITVTSSKLLNIYWGDGQQTYDVSGTNKTITHTYSEAGEYDIVVTGVIEDIKAFDTNAIVIWDRLL